jgi:hypothetical protein
MEFGTAVKAYPLDESGPVVGFYLGESGDKSVIQVGADKHELALREPANYDEHGPNGTFCKL